MNATEIASETEVMFFMTPAYEVAERDGLVDRIAGCDAIESAEAGEGERRYAIVERIRSNGCIADEDSGIQCRIIRSIGEEIRSQRMGTFPVTDALLVRRP